MYSGVIFASMAGEMIHWLREVCGVLWAVAGLAGFAFAVTAFGIQRDRRAEQSIDARFDDEFSEMCDAMEKNPAYAQAQPGWRDVHLERRRAALSQAEASRWQSASLFWMLATGCALAAVVMLYVSGGYT
jgi:hypothetical protein